MRLLPALLIFSTLALVAAGSSSYAQEKSTPAKVEVSGVVLSALTGEPVAAAVEIPGLRRTRYANASGRFSFGRLRPGSYGVMVYALGYKTLIDELVVAERTVVTIELQPDPVVLEGIEVVVSRLEARRLSAPISVRVYEERELLSTTAFDAEEFVRRRALWPARPGGFFGLARTASSAVYIDERLAPFGLSQLGFYRPDDFHLIEVYGGGREVRAYTPQYIERLARGEASFALIPIGLPLRRFNNSSVRWGLGGQPTFLGR